MADEPKDIEAEIKELEDLAEELSDDSVPYAALGVDYDNRILFLEFAEAVDFFAIDLDTARSLVEAMQKGIRALQDS